MTIFQAIVLGALQGLGEFLPISSSAHLWLVPWLFGWEYQGIAFDVALHLGTLTAVIVYFWKDWLTLTLAGFTKPSSHSGRLFWWLAAATIPGAIIGYLLEDAAESIFRHPISIALLLMIMGLVLYWADHNGRKRIHIDQMKFNHAMGIGIAQAAAILPGVSRSGATMTAGMMMGLTSEAAARFSFLLSAPIIGGAGILQIKELIETPGAINAPFIAGIVSAALVGLLSIGFLLKYLRNNGFKLFAYYRLLIGLVVLVVYFLRG